MKLRSQYICQQCTFTTPKWMGKCPDCGAWNSLIEEVVAAEDKRSRSLETSSELPSPLHDIGSETFERIELPLKEFNRCLGGGLTQGSVLLLGGDPGIGKSTLLLQLLGVLARQRPHEKFLYVSAEESKQQIHSRAKRMNILEKNIFILSETNVQSIFKVQQELAPLVCVVDSVQTVYWPELASIPGSVSQVREVADRLVRNSKKLSMATFLVGHITKDGNLAGPKTLEHLVDTVLQFEGDNHQIHRILRVLKNRFGPTDEIGVFEMNEQGLKEIENPSALFLEHRPKHTPGSVVNAMMEGSRPFLVEVQGLTSSSAYGMPLRNAVGFDKNRLTMLLAVLEKRASLELSTQDVYINVVGGLKITEPAADLSILTSVISSYLAKPFFEKTVVFGEVGLSGEIRPSPLAELRLKEAKKLGFEKAFGPKMKDLNTHGLDYVPLNSVTDLMRVFGKN